ncbi:hypothetical protein BB559_001730 [Furculomyces boomerangus]|uniref:EF-hand domain-containing protein n=1 Tax=Furculomyces boomerangus TaxID=61424 RepID=A0A2T9Z0W8_9FUNG|nr:hypothetical protein BB559_001730 [Furculomyces boomerangus]
MISNLPEEIFHMVASHLTTSETLNLFLINHRFLNILNQNFLWKRKYINDFGDLELYIKLLNDAGIPIDEKEIDLFGQNHLPVSIGSETKLYCRELNRYKQRYTKVHLISPTMLDSKRNSKDLLNEEKTKRADSVAQTLTRVKEGLLDIENTLSQKNNKSENNVEHINDIIGFFGHLSTTVLLAMNEFPWEPECFHLLGFICYMLGSNEVALEFLKIGVAVCEHEEYSHRNDNNSMDIDEMSAQIEKKLHINENTADLGIILKKKNEIMALYQTVESHIKNMRGTNPSEDFPLVTKDHKQLDERFILLLKRIFGKFDLDNDNYLNLEELGYFVTYLNVDNMITCPVSSMSTTSSIQNTFDSLITQLKSFETKLSFAGLCRFYFDQSLEDPEETRNDINKLQLLLDF